MRVAVLTKEYPPEVYGGAGVHVEYLTRELASFVEVEVHCFGPPRQDPLVAAAYGPWAELPAAGAGAALQAMAADLRMAAGVGRADLAHSHTWYANLGGHLAKLLHGIPHVLTAHSLEPLRPWKAEQLGGGYALSSFCERTAMASADAIIAVSRSMADDVIEQYPDVDPARVQVIHNGIDPDEYRSDPRTDVLERYGIDPDRPIVMWIGRVTAQKGVGHLLDAAAWIEPAAQLVLCAGAPDTPAIGDEMRDRAAALAESRGGVHWIEEMLPRSEAVQLFSHADVFVCPSVYEPFGLINLEAMACGVPVVATAVGGIPEIVVDGETGYLVAFEADSSGTGAPADAAALAGALSARVNELLGDPARAATFGAAGRQRVLDRFTWQAVARTTAELYGRLIGPG